MVGSVSSTGTSAFTTSFTQSAATGQDVAVAVVKKIQDIEQAQGEAALKLIDSASSPTSSGKIDVYA